MKVAAALVTAVLALGTGCERGGPKPAPPPPPALQQPLSEDERWRERVRLQDEVFKAELERQLGDARCPEGFELMGAPKPRGSGMWCQKHDAAAKRLEAQRVGGKRWVVVENLDAEGGPEKGGRTTVYAEDGETVARIVERRDHETVHFEEPVPGVEVPPGVPMR